MPTLPLRDRATPFTKSFQTEPSFWLSYARFGSRCPSRGCDPTGVHVGREGGFWRMLFNSVSLLDRVILPPLPIEASVREHATVFTDALPHSSFTHRRRPFADSRAAVKRPIPAWSAIVGLRSKVQGHRVSTVHRHTACPNDPRASRRCLPDSRGNTGIRDARSDVEIRSVPHSDGTARTPRFRLA